jgi:hypothetical protein
MAWEHNIQENRIDDTDNLCTVKELLQTVRVASLRVDDGETIPEIRGKPCLSSRLG